MMRAVYADGLLDPATGETTRDAVVLIDGDRVVRVGARASVQVPRDAEAIDAGGLTLLLRTREFSFVRNADFTH